MQLLKWQQLVAHNMEVENIYIKEYNYTLPEERIASYPQAKRDISKLLIFKEGDIAEDVFKNIVCHIPENSLLIFNDTKVLEARLLFKKMTGAVIEIFCLEPHEQYPDITTAMLQKGKVRWKCLVGGVSKWKHQQVLEKKIKPGDKEIVLQARYINKSAQSFTIELSWTPAEMSFAEVLHFAGVIPLPPYIKRTVEESDKERYQTVYAHVEGSVAAPTAGLHFTDTIFEKCKEKNIQTDFVTLHVGAGTFKPVKTETMIGHEMHAEIIHVSKETIENILRNLENNIIAVGTTSLRTLETLYWLGVKTSLDPESIGELNLSQWEAYELAQHSMLPKNALSFLLNYMNKKRWTTLVAKTQLLIIPGYKFKIANALVTNFHQPQSTLLLLVAALIGNDLPDSPAGISMGKTGRENWQKVYEYALSNNFRFLSYGDGNLLWAKKD